MTIKAFLFDLDGVIVDTAVFHYQAWRRMANSLGFDISEGFNEKLKGISRTESLEMILKEGNIELSEEKKQQLAKEKNAWYLELVSQMTPEAILPNADNFIREAKQLGIKIALGSVSKNAPLILEKIQLTDQFDAIIDGTKITKGKPDPEVFLKGAAELGVLPTECVVFEDAEAGIQAAKNGNMKAIGIGSPSILILADIVIPSFENITPTELLQKIA